MLQRQEFTVHSYGEELVGNFDVLIQSIPHWFHIRLWSNT